MMTHIQQQKSQNSETAYTLPAEPEETTNFCSGAWSSFSKTMGLEQWFPIGGIFPPRGHLAMSRDNVDCHIRGQADAADI